MREIDRSLALLGFLLLAAPSLALADVKDPVVDITVVSQPGQSGCAVSVRWEASDEKVPPESGLEHVRVWEGLNLIFSGGFPPGTPSTAGMIFLSVPMGGRIVINGWARDYVGRTGTDSQGVICGGTPPPMK